MKVIKIENCGECPTYAGCAIANLNDTVIPEICPLENGECERKETKAVFSAEGITSCGHTIHVWYPLDMAPYCPFCGKKIKEVGDEGD